VNIIVRDMDNTREHFEAAIARVGRGDANKAFNRALNREGDKTRTQVRRALRKQTGAKAGLISQQTKSTRSSYSKLTYTITASGGHLGLSHFSPRQFKYGVRAKPWGRSQQFKSAFIVGSLGGNVFVRSSSARFPIKKMYGPAIPKEMVKDETARTFEEHQPAVLEEATRQLQMLVEG
jgi:hypothetical protein